MDQDDDGVLDLVVTRSNGTLAWSRGLGDATFETPVVLAQCEPYPALLSGDLDADGRPDLVLLQYGPPVVQVWMSPRGGTIELAQSTSVPIAPFGHELADLDGDMDLDLVTLGASPTVILMLENDGAGTLSPAATVTCTGCKPGALAVGELSGDHRPDLVITEPDRDLVRVLRQDANGAFVPWASIPISLVSFPSGLSLGDFDADGHQDVAVQSGSFEIFVARGLGAGQFAAPAAIDPPALTTGIETADLDENGIDDLLSAGYVVRAAFGGVSGLSTPMAIGGTPFPDGRSSLADLNADGDLDLVSCGLGLNRPLTVLRGSGDGRLEPTYRQLAAFLEYGDVDADGHGDLIGRYEADSSHLALMRGLPFGDVAEALDAYSTDFVSSFALADFDADGLLDCLAASSSTKVMLHLGTRSSGFADPTLVWTGPGGGMQPFPSAGDVDGDGDADAVFAAGSTMKVLLGAGDGTFAELPAKTIPGGARDPWLIDLDADGNLDLVVGTGAGIAVKLGAGDGSFGTTVLPADGATDRIAVADIDGDLDQDLLGCGFSSQDVTVLLNDGQGGFSEVEPLPLAESKIQGLAAADFDADGHVDLATLTEGSFFTQPGHVHIYTGNGDGAFQWLQSFIAPPTPIDLIAADMNADGVADLIASPGPTVFVSRAGPWKTLGHALAGANGLPRLEAEGSLLPASPTTFGLDDAASGSPAWLVSGLSAGYSPFRGGVMVPEPRVLSGPHPTDPTGKLMLLLEWPVLVPPGMEQYHQVWIQDDEGPLGFAASNAISGVTP